MRVCHFRTQNDPFILNKFFWYKSLLLLSTYWPFSLCKIWKHSYSRSRVMRICHFWNQNGPFAPSPPKIFFWKIINIILIYLLAPSLCKILEKLFWQIQSYEQAQFLGPKWPISPNENFFRKPVNETYFFHSCLSTCQKSKWDINLLVKYWRSKNTEISLTQNNFWS